VNWYSARGRQNKVKHWQQVARRRTEWQREDAGEGDDQFATEWRRPPAHRQQTSSRYRRRKNRDREGAGCDSTENQRFPEVAPITVPASLRESTSALSDRVPRPSRSANAWSAQWLRSTHVAFYVEVP